MSTIAERAREEGDRAEAEGQEPEQVEAEEAEEAEVPFEEPEPVQPPDEAQAAAIDKALTAEDTRHNKALGKIYGEQWPEHVRCALCDGIGFLSPELAAGLTNAQWEQLLETAVTLVSMPLVADKNYQRCEHCDGWGKTISGAQNADHYTKLCDVCSGNGFIQRTPSFTPPPVIPMPEVNGTPPAPVIPNYGSPAVDDAWGRPGGHPHYGIPPAAVQ
jgi:hypothetical protein